MDVLSNKKNKSFKSKISPTDLPTAYLDMNILSDLFKSPFLKASLSSAFTLWKKSLVDFSSAYKPEAASASLKLQAFVSPLSLFSFKFPCAQPE